jgi:hypothetical protein
MKKRIARLIISSLLLSGAGDLRAQWQTNGTSIYYNSGNVGIGTSSPPTNLSVAKAIDEAGLSSALQFVGPFNIGVDNDFGSGQALQYLLLNPYYASGTNPQAGISGTLSFYRGTTASFNFNGDYHVNIQSAYSSTNASLVPLNEYSPLVPLYTVTYNSKPYVAIKMSDMLNSSCNINFTGYWWNGYDGTKPQLVLASALTNITLYKSYQAILSNIVTGTSAGNVGIGTTNPQAPLELTKSTGSSAMGDILRINSVDGNAGNGGGILFTNNTNINKMARIAGIDAGNWGGHLAFYTAAGTGSSPGGTPVERVRIDEYGNVGIGTTDTKGYNLAVNGTGIMTKLVVKSYGNWPDYVFDSSYRLQSLDEVKSFIDKNHHLPGIEPAMQLQDSGLDVGANQTKLLEKIEELTLYILKQQQVIEQQKGIVQEQKEVLQKQDQRLQKLESLFENKSQPIITKP